MQQNVTHAFVSEVKWIGAIISVAVGIALFACVNVAHAQSNGGAGGVVESRTPENLHDISRLLEEAKKELRELTLSRALGGADGIPSFDTIDRDGTGCRTLGEDMRITLTGVYSSAPGLTEIIPVWWGKKFPVCKLVDHIEWGDMVYFLLEGNKIGDTLSVTLTGPEGRRAFNADMATFIHLPDGGCTPRRVGSRIGLVIPPSFGTGDYALTVTNGTRSQIFPFYVSAPNWPKYGFQTGNTRHPLLVEGDTPIRFVLAGYPPNSTTTIIIFSDTISTSDLDYGEPSQGGPLNSTVADTFEVVVNDSGWAEFEFAWPDKLSAGLYSFSNLDAMNIDFRTGADRDISPFQGWAENDLSESGLDYALGAAYATMQILARPDLAPGTGKLRRRTDFYSLEVLGDRPRIAKDWHSVTGVASDDVLNVRDAPKGAKIGELHPRAEGVLFMEERSLAGSSSWVRIDCGDRGPWSGWVNSRFLVRSD